MSLRQTARLLEQAMAETTPFRDLLHRSVALRAAERTAPDAHYTAICDERSETEDAIKARLCVTLGLTVPELMMLGDIL